jgi:hypothetical protein
MVLAREEWYLLQGCRRLDAALQLCRHHWAAGDYLLLRMPAKEDFPFSFLETLNLFHLWVIKDTAESEQC